MMRTRTWGVALAAMAVLLVGHVPESLAQDGDKKAADKKVLRDRLGDPLPAGAVMRLGTMRYRSNFTLPSLAFAPRGKLLANGSTSNMIEVWNTATGRRLHQLEVTKGEGSAVAFDPKGTLLAVGGDGVVDLWEMPSGKKRGELQHVGFDVLTMAFSADGRTLAVSGGGSKIVLWDAGAQKRLADLEGHTGDVTAVAFSTKGKTFASASRDGTVKLWALSRKGGKATRTIEAHEGSPVTALALSPDGRSLISGGDDIIRMWDTRKGKLLGEYKGHEDRIRGLAFSAKGKLFASAAEDDQVIIWASRSDTALHEFTAPGATAVSFSPKGDRLAAGGEGISLWDVGSGTDMLASLGHRTSARTVRFMGDGRTLASGGQERDVFLWEASTGHELQTLANPANSPFVAVSPNGKYLAAGGRSPQIQLWDIAAGKIIHKLGPHGRQLVALEFSPDGRTLASSSLDGVVRIWNTATGKLHRQISGEGGFARALAFSPKGRTIATGVHKDWFGGQSGVAVWHADTGALMFRILTGDTPVVSVAFAADGASLATGHSDGRILIWDVTSSQQLKALQGHASHIRGLDFSPKGGVLASCSTDKTVRLWDLTTGNELKTFKGHANTVYSIDFSPKGDRLASASADSTILIWQTP